MSVEDKLNRSFDFLLDQMAHGVSIEDYKKGSRWYGLQQVKEWKSLFGYQFQIYSNDHFIDNKPHFHLLKPSNDIDCRYFFDGTLVDCSGKGAVEKKIIEPLVYFLSETSTQERLIGMWNAKNPNLFYKSVI